MKTVFQSGVVPERQPVARTRPHTDGLPCFTCFDYQTM